MHIKKIFNVSMLTLILFGLYACEQDSATDNTASEVKPVAAAPATSAANPEPSPFITTASIQDIMLAIVDPSADYLWESVSTVSTLDGVVENRPQTDEDWLELRYKAIALLEATNLLAIKGRHVVEEGKKLQDEGLEGNLTSAQIQQLIDDDHKTFEAFAHGLHGASVEVLKAIDNKDVDAFLQAGGDLDTACEACHTKYWYPNQGITYGN